MEPASVRLFGSPALIDERGEHLLRAERRDQLLAYLACCNRWVTRDQLSELFWGDRSQGAARSNLRYVVLQVRRAAIQGVEVRGDALRWCISSDVQRFERAVSARDWQTALDAQAGTLLDGFEIGAPPPFADWLSFERARVAALRQHALAARFAQLHDDPEACAALAVQVLRADPLNEAALGAHLRAHRALGRPEAAQRVWRAYVERLAADHGIEPTAELHALAVQVQTAPVACGADASKPVSGSDCVGRRLELTQIRELLGDANCRLLTLTGPGGVGKSTLARATLPLASAQFGDGSTWVALEDLAQADEVVPRIAALVALQLTGAETALAQLTRHLRARHTLLVFDNAEHLSGFDRIAETLIHDCERLKLLVTSRVRIAVAGEWLLPLEGMPVPDRDEHDVDVLRAFDAVRLFELRAHALSPAFELSAHAADVVELAHAVEGLPLALELAAAWTRLLPVREIVGELTRSLDLLDLPGGSGARDRGLRASFEHSWRMLTPIEREVLPRLGVFVGSFSRAAAEHVAHAPLQVLGALVDKSLLRAGGDGRFSLHPLLRQCALERLLDGDATRRRHAEHYAQLVSRDGDRVDPRLAIPDVELELSNCLAAWHLSVELRLLANIERMASPISRYVELRGRSAEGIALMQMATRVLDARNPSERRAYGRALWNRAVLLLREARFAEAEDVARDALRLLCSARDRSSMVGCLNSLGLSLQNRGMIEEARRCYERGLRRAQVDGNDHQASVSESNLAVVEEMVGHYEGALALYKLTLARQRQSGDRFGLVRTLNNVSILHRMRHEPEAALPYLEEGLRICRETNSAATEPYLVFNLAWTHLERGDLALAEKFSTQATSLAHERAVPEITIGAPLQLARIAIARGQPALALTRVRDSLTLARESRHEAWQVFTLGIHAEWLAVSGERVRAATYWNRFIGDPASSAGERADAGDALNALALSDAEAESAREAAEGLTLDAAIDAIFAEPTPEAGVSGCTRTPG